MNSSSEKPKYRQVSTDQFKGLAGLLNEQDAEGYDLVEILSKQVVPEYRYEWTRYTVLLVRRDEINHG